MPHFTDVTDAAGVGMKGVGMGVAVGDVDGDGWLDLYVTAFGSNLLYRNRGDGSFEDVTARAHVDDPRWTSSAAFLDYDRDGDQDLFLANYVAFTKDSNKVCTDHAGARDYCPPGAYAPVPTRLFRNDGGMAFSDVTVASGIARAYGAGLGVAVGDLNGDGWPDVYVANDATPNQLWINRRDGTFEDEGVIRAPRSTRSDAPKAAWASHWAMPTTMETRICSSRTSSASPRAVHERRERQLRGCADQVGVAPPRPDMTGFGTGWIDYDSDGRLDLFSTNGAVNIVEGQRGQAVPYRQQSQLFHNEGNGRFRDVSSQAGPFFERLLVGRGVAFGDLDNDGDVDIVVTTNNGPAFVLLNSTSPRPRHRSEEHWIATRSARP